MKHAIQILLIVLLVTAPALGLAAVKGDIYTWQMKKFFDWTAQEFPDMVEENSHPEKIGKGLTGEDVGKWQMKKFEWTAQEFPDLHTPPQTID